MSQQLPIARRGIARRKKTWKKLGRRSLAAGSGARREDSKLTSSMLRKLWTLATKKKTIYCASPMLPIIQLLTLHLSRVLTISEVPYKFLAIGIALEKEEELVIAIGIALALALECNYKKSIEDNDARLRF